VAARHCTKGDETEEQLICDSDSNCYTDDEGSGTYDRNCEDEEDEKLIKSSLPSRETPQKHDKMGVNNFSSGVVGIKPRI
jgi:hypothetical protein